MQARAMRKRCVTHIKKKKKKHFSRYVTLEMEERETQVEHLDQSLGARPKLRAALANVQMDTWHTSNPKSVSLVLLLPRSHPGQGAMAESCRSSLATNTARLRGSQIVISKR